MKKHLIKASIVLFFFLFFIFSFKSNIKAEVIIDQKTDIQVENDIIGFDQENNYRVLIYENFVTIYYQELSLKLEGKYKAHTFKNDVLYLALNDELLKINKNEIVKSIKIDGMEIIDLLSDEYLYASGSLSASLTIVELDYNLNVVRNYHLNDPVNTKITKLLKHNNYYFALIERKHHDKESLFKNIGNYNDQKTCLIKFDKRFNILNILYVNLNKEKEVPKYLNIIDDLIYFVVNDEQHSYYFNCDLNLENLSLVKKCEEQSKILIDYNNHFIGFSFDQFLKITGSDNVYDLNIKNPLNVKIVDDELKVYSEINNHIEVFEISEYHINKIDNFKIGFDYGNYDFNNDLNHNDVIDVCSYFTKVEVLSNTRFEKNIAGLIDLELVVKINKIPDIKVSTKVEIEPYVNIMNEHIYPTNKTLNFLGQGLLDGKNITSGYTLKTQGEHQFILKDNQNNSYNYHFYVVDNYQRDDLIVENIDYYVLKNEEFKISLKLNGITDIEKVIMDNKERIFEVIDDTLIIKIQNESANGLFKHVLNEIQTKDKNYKLNQVINVYTKKDVPNIDVVEDETDELNLKLKIDDKDQAILCFKFVSNVETFINYLKDESFSVSNNTNDLKMYVLYDLGDGNIKEVFLMELKGIVKKGSDFISLTFDSTNSVNLSFKTKNMTTIDKVNIQNEALNYDYVVNNNYTNIIVSLIVTLIIIFIIAFFFIVKFKKKKKQ